MIIPSYSVWLAIHFKFIHAPSKIFILQVLVASYAMLLINVHIYARHSLAPLDLPLSVLNRQTGRALNEAVNKYKLARQHVH